MNQTDPQHRDGDLNSFPETQNRQTDTKEMQSHGDTRLNQEEDEHNAAQAIHSNKDQLSFLYLTQPSAFPDCDVQKPPGREIEPSCPHLLRT